jgi:hypothetical protein
MRRPMRDPAQYVAGLLQDEKGRSSRRAQVRKRLRAIEDKSGLQRRIGGIRLGALDGAVPHELQIKAVHVTGTKGGAREVADRPSAPLSGPRQAVSRTHPVASR